MTGNIVPGPDLILGWMHALADVHDLHAAGLEPAAWRRINGLRDFTPDIRNGPVIRWIGDGDRRNERFGIRVQGICNHFPGWRHFHHLPQVHDNQALRDIGQD